MSMHDPSMLETAAAASSPEVKPDAGMIQAPENGIPEYQNVSVDTEGKLAATQEPTLTAPPDDIVYPEERLGLQDAGTGAGAPGITPIPIPILRRLVSGRYIGTSGGFRIELRVDVDKPRHQNMASFDFFSIGSVTNYFGSFRINSPSISYTSTQVIVDGYFTGTKSVWANRARIVIARNLIFQIAAPATITFYKNAAKGAVYSCAFNSSFFRSVKLEMDAENGTALFASYNTGSLPSPLPHRNLSVVKAYEEAGVQLQLTTGTDVVNNAEAGADSRWTETELHASMVRHFSVFSNLPQWAVWMFAARRATSSTLLGIMFDYLGVAGLKPHRQGSAAFQDTIKGYHPGADDYNRHLLYTYVHEIGHAFNLLHSWDKSRPDSLSWMNYDWKYDQRNGFGSYWNNFGFVFDDGELRHLRHGYRDNVIMGGSNWAVGAGLTQHDEADVFSQVMVENKTGLAIELEPVKKTFALGEPVVCEIKLRCRDMDGMMVNAHLHPKHDQVRIGIAKPNGQVLTYEPVSHYCSAPEEVALNKDNSAVYTSAYIGYGKDGFYFDQPGFYRLKAAYATPEGDIIQSEEISIRVKSPVTKAEDEIADKYFGSDTGMCFYLLGSDSPALQSGMDDLREISEKYKTNDLSIYADLVLGVNESMLFKTVDTKDKKIITRKRDMPHAKTRLQKVINASKGEEGIDNITLNFAFRQLAKGYWMEKDDKNAKAVLKEMEDTFKHKNLKAPVLARISEQADKVLKTKR